MSETPEIYYTDGACGGRADRRKGGWCYVRLVKQDDCGYKTEHKTGVKKDTTNNEMELTAAYLAILDSYKRGVTNVEIHTDSMYVVNSIGRDWLTGWKENEWKTSQDKEVKNLDIWKKVYKLIYEKGMRVKMVWVKGHSNDPLNNLSDTLAVQAYEELE